MRDTGRGQRGGASTCRADVRVPVHALARRWESPRWGCWSCSQRSRPSPPDPPIRPPFRPAPRPTPLARAIPIYAGAARRCPRRPATPARADSPRPARRRCTALGVAEVAAGRHAPCFEFEPTGMPEPAQATEARAAYSSKQVARRDEKAHGPRRVPFHTANDCKVRENPDAARHPEIAKIPLQISQTQKPLRTSENRGVPGSSPGLAIAQIACTFDASCAVSTVPDERLRATDCAQSPKRSPKRPRYEGGASCPVGTRSARPGHPRGTPVPHPHRKTATAVPYGPSPY